MKKLRLAAAALALIMLLGCSERNLDGGRPSSSEPEPPAAEQGEPPGGEDGQSSSGDDEEEPAERAKPYADMLLSGKYYIDGTAEISMEGMTLSNPMLIAVDGENSSITVSSDLSGAMVTMRTLIFEGAIYMVNDAARSYAEIPAEQAANSFDTDYSALQYMGSGSGDFCGSELEFEEYDQNGDTVRFFFDGDSLAGITRSIEDEQLSEMTLRINAISQNIPDRLIAMPIGYQKQ